jgi:methionyl-tRNA formyltransferase
MPIRIVFMGSPQFAVPVLQSLSREYPIAGVVTQPDRPAGRGRTLTPPPVKTLAVALGLQLIQPRRLRDPEVMAQLQSWKPDIIVVAAFGQILRQEVLDLPVHGCINVHASLLPRWRGAAPIQAAILNRDERTGITIMKMDAGIDTGGILNQQAIAIQEDDTAGTLGKRLAELGAVLLLKTLAQYLAGQLVPRKQNDELATYAPMLKKEDGLLDFNRPAEELECQVRATQPWPGSYFLHNGVMLKIQRASVLPHPVTGSENATPGGLTCVKDYPAVYTSDGLLILEIVQPAGKRIMPGSDFLRGAKDWGSPDERVN